MRTVTFILFVLFISCTTQKSDETSTDDSTTVAATSDSLALARESQPVAEPVVYEESATAIQSDTAWLSAFANDPLGFISHEDMINYLRQSNIEFKDTIIHDETQVTFGNSYMYMNVTEAYGDLICSAYIDTPAFGLSGGISIGMTREEFLEVTGVLPEPGKDSFEYELVHETWSQTVTFYFDEKNFTGLRYNPSDCIIYD